MSFTPSFKGTTFPVAAKLKALASEEAVEGLNIAFLHILLYVVFVSWMLQHCYAVKVRQHEGE